MNNFFNTFKTKARETRLALEEKQGMRIKLYEVMERFPIGEPIALKSAKPVKSFYTYNWFSVRYMAPAMAVLLIVLGSGTAYAAQSALPGQPLYAVKVNINEPVQVALATTPQAKAEANASIAQTRLEEAETLAAQGDLNASTSAQLAQNFDQHAQVAQAITQSLAVSDPASAAQLSANFDSSLSAHDAILNQIASSSTSTSTKVDSATLAMQIRSREHTNEGGAASPAIVAVSTFAALNPEASSAAATTSTTSAARLPKSAAFVLTASSTSTSSPTAPEPTATATSVSLSTSTELTIALSLQANASTSLAQAQNDFATLESSLDASTSAQVSANLDALAAHMSAGTSALNTSDSTQAKSEFEAALRGAVRLDAFLQAAQNINKTLLPELLNKS